jgi:putative colanic acid biosynthesis UDP-glucose lipid carrier transferase
MHGAQQQYQDGGAEGFAARGPSLSLEERPNWSIGYASVEAITILSDIATILFAAILSGALYRLQVSSSSAGFVGIGIIVSALFVLWMKSRRVYELPSLLDLRRQVATVCFVWICIFLLLSGAAFATNLGGNFAQPANIFFAVLGLTLLIAHRILWKELLSRGVRAKHIGRRVALIADHLSADPITLSDTLQRLGFRMERRFTVPPMSQGVRRREHALSQAIAWVRRSDVDEVVVAGDPNQWLQMRGAIDALRVLSLPVSFVPVGPTVDIFRRRVRALGDAVCVELQTSPLSPFECALKRGMDIAAAASALVILSPFLLLVMLAIKLDSPGPLLFRQTRCGFNGRPFQIVKFRTMTVTENGALIEQARAADPRVTRVGKWLRRASVDELPQLLNVLAGSMSLVGPRPHALAHDIAFDGLVRNYAFRQRVKPGLTGWAQIHGLRGPTPNPESVRTRVEHDLWYIDHWSIGLDFLIVLKTVTEVMRGRNAY